MEPTATTFERRQKLPARVFVLTASLLLVASAHPSFGQAKNANAGKKGSLSFPPSLNLDKLAPRKIFELRGHSKPVNSVAFNFDGSLLASGGDDGKIIFWNMNDGNNARNLENSGDPVRGLAYSSSDKTIIFYINNNPIEGMFHTYDLITTKIIRRATNRGGHFYALAINRPSTLVAFGGGDRALRVLDLRRVVGVRRDGNKQIPQYFMYAPPALPKNIHCIDFYPRSLNKPLIAVGCQDGYVQLYEITGPQEDGIRPFSVRIARQNGAVSCVKFSPDGKLLATTGADGMIRLRNAITGELVRTIDAVNSPVNWLSFSPDSQLLADARDDKSVRLWKVENGKELFALREHTAPVRGVEFAPDGKRLASCDADFGVLVWNLFPPEVKKPMRGRKGDRGAKRGHSQ